MPSTLIHLFGPLPTPYRKIGLGAAISLGLVVLFALANFAIMRAVVTMPSALYYPALAGDIVVLIMLAISILVTCARLQALVLYCVRGTPSPAMVYHTTSKTAAARIRAEGAIRPGSAWTNLGSAVYVSTERYPGWSNCVSVNDRWPFLHITYRLQLERIPILVRNPERLLWNGVETFIVRTPIILEGDSFVV